MERDDIAIFAMNGMLSDSEHMQAFIRAEGHENPADMLARKAYEIADAMIKESRKEKG